MKWIQRSHLPLDVTDEASIQAAVAAVQLLHQDRNLDDNTTWAEGVEAVGKNVEAAGSRHRHLRRTERENTMTAIVQDTDGSADVLELRDIDKPVVGDDDLLVRAHAAQITGCGRSGETR
jgi:hypothetical protein